MVFDPLAPPPLLTEDLPGIGGRIKQVPEDFEVDEIPAYEPCGTGGYLYLWLEKRGLGAEFFIRQLARRLGISPGEVGTAGMKDRQALTRQFVSVPDVGSERLAECVSRNRHKTAEQIVAAVHEDVNAFSFGGLHTDDKVLMLLKVTEGGMDSAGLRS